MVIQYHGKNFYWSAKKLMINILVILLIISFWMIYISNDAKAVTDKKIIEITVHRGDTLWSIAKKIAPESDPRTMIKYIKTRNHLNETALTAGQKLQIEVESNNI